MTDSHPRPIRLGIVTDFSEERWESMDLVAEMVTAQLHLDAGLGIVPLMLTPAYRPVFGRMSISRLAWNLDRLINRRRTLPQGVRKAIEREKPDAVFVVDHSYANVVPTVRAAGVPVVVLCHDLDALTPLIGPRGTGLKARLHRWFAQPILDGLLRADHVITVSNTVRDALLKHFGDRISADRVTTVPNGVAAEFRPGSAGVAWPFHGLEDATRPMLLHVGSTIPRKRIDVLLETLAIAAKTYPNLTLVRVGGPLTEPQRRQAESLGVSGRIREMPRLTRAEVAELYRRADVVLVTSDAEGFGLPVAEALACGASVAASDIPVLRETGGPCVRYAMPGDAVAFAAIVCETLAAERGSTPPEVAEARRAWTNRYRWEAFAADLAAIVRILCTT